MIGEGDRNEGRRSHEACQTDFVCCGRRTQVPVRQPVICTKSVGGHEIICMYVLLNIAMTYQVQGFRQGLDDICTSPPHPTFSQAGTSSLSRLSQPIDCRMRFSTLQRLSRYCMRSALANQLLWTYIMQASVVLLPSSEWSICTPGILLQRPTSMSYKRHVLQDVHVLATRVCG